MSPKSSSEAPKTRERILDAAVNVLAQRGYSAAGVQEIVDRSGTSKGSFYFHFSSKEKMMTALVDQVSWKLVEKVQSSIQDQPTAVHRLASGIEILMATFSRQHKFAQILLLSILGHGRALDRKFLPLWERFTSLIKQELDAAVSQGQIRQMDTSLVAQIWIGALHQVIVKWLVTGHPNPLTSATPALKDTLLRSIGADPASGRC